MLFLGVIVTLTLLGLALYSSRRARLDPVARSLTLLAADLAIWNLGATLFAATGEATWHWLDVSFSPLTPPLVLELVTSYVGLGRRLRLARLAAWLWFVPLALASASAWFHAWGRDFILSAPWSVIYLCGWLPILSVSLWLLVREARRTRDTPAMAMRARLLIAALLLGGILGSTELWNDLFMVPGLGAIGVAAAALLITAVVFRFELVARERVAATVYLGLVLLVGGVVLAAVTVASDGHGLASVIAAVFVLGLVATLGGELAQGFAAARARTLELASLGRFTAQMSHDLKNPLAAMKGAIQYLQGAAASGAGSVESEMLDLAVAQIARMDAILTRYGRLASVTPEMAPLDVHALAAEVVRARTVGTSINARLTDERVTPGPIEGDRDLLASAFENIVNNAIQAMGEAGTITLTTREHRGLVEVAIADTGPGIEPRFLERVADDFFTTRANGSGLGLAFVRRIAAAHGGRLAIASEPTLGTTVSLELPASPRKGP